MALPLAAPAVAAAAPAVAAAAPAAAGGGTAAAQGMAANLLNDFIAALAASGVTSVINPPAIPSAGTDSSGKYFIGDETALRLLPTYRGDQFRTNFFNSLGFDLPMPPTPEEVLGNIEARRERQARSLTDREIEKLRANRAFDVTIERIIQDALVQKAELDALAGVKKQELQSAGDVRSQEFASLGQAQAERLRSSYDMAGRTLQSAIENVLKSGVINDRSTQVELAKIM
jgi:cell division septum initiation protein DivIVA